MERTKIPNLRNGSKGDVRACVGACMRACMRACVRVCVITTSSFLIIDHTRAWLRC